MMWSNAARKNPPVPHAGSQIRMSGPGCITSTMAEINARGVKYWPAPDLVSAAFFSSSPS